MTERELCIADNVKRVQERIANAAQKTGRNMEDIKLICVTKNFGVEDMAAALACGVTAVWENRVQELCDKYDKVHP